MNALDLIPVIFMHSIPLPGLEEQVISVYKETSINAIEYAMQHTNEHILLALDYQYHAQKLQHTNENIKEIEEKKETVKAAVLCKIMNQFVENKEGKRYTKLLLSTKMRFVLEKTIDASFDGKEIIVAHAFQNYPENESHLRIALLNHGSSIDLSNNTKNEKSEEIEQGINYLIQKFKNYADTYGSNHLPQHILDETDYAKKIDKIAYELNPNQSEIFQLIIEFDLRKRIKIALGIIDSAILKHQLNKMVDLQLKEQIEKNQKIYLLTEKSKVINKEIEALTGESSDADALEKKLESINGISDEIRNKLQSEIRRLKISSANSADGSVSRNYLDWCLNMPWNTYSDFKKNFADVYDDLNREHYGMEKVKERILEYLAVSFREGATAKSALLLVGPPGVGKTSLSKKIADALGRKFARISLGGVRDEADIRGHRRTYLGSMPGKIIRAIREAKTMNPVILLDEIDKMGNDFRGDPAAALLEVLDKEQNKDFLDHYLDIPFDISNSLFICTANSLNSISRPLLDRVEIIYLSSYSDQEKLKIALDYMIPKQTKEHGLSEAEIVFDLDAVKKIISRYTYEAGVRNLEEQLSIIMRKTLLKIINQKKEVPIEISTKSLEEFLGLPKYLRESDKTPMVGVIHGLAWNELGGDVLTIECIAVPNKTKHYNGSIKYTGKLGEVMQESIQAAFSYLKSCANIIGIDESSYKSCDIHLHVPEGATPKDGPSAGITIFTVLCSLLLKKKIRSDIAMTGEITLRGRVLAIGGLKEKILAAKRNGINTILIPKENERELQEVPAELKENLEIILVENAIESLNYSFFQEKKTERKKSVTARSASTKRKKRKDEEVEIDITSIPLNSYNHIPQQPTI
jgi:ATP-dependent Lon protease